MEPKGPLYGCLYSNNTNIMTATVLRRQHTAQGRHKVTAFGIICFGEFVFHFVADLSMANKTYQAHAVYYHAYT